jgi:amino acid adenylation domain-containing protein
MSLGAWLKESAQRYSARPAVWVDGTSYSYAHLFDRASQMAAKLAPHRKPGATCALLVRRDFDGLSAVLGTVLAGMGYVPIGRQLPPQRIASLMNRLQPVAAIIGQADAAQISAVTDHIRAQAVVRLSDCLPASGEGLSNDAGDSREDLAYVLFTSGSTGMPKGVPITRGSVVDYIHGITSLYPIAPEDRCTQLFELTFDLSAHDLFVAWTSGACLYVPPRGEVLGAVDMVRKHQITSWFSGPSALTLFERMRKLTPAAMPSLQLALSCGERLTWAQASLLQQAAPNARIVNLYGPTEATIAITHFDFTSANETAQDLLDVPIGAPLPGQFTVAVNENNEPIAPGETGELLLGGSQLATGYLGDPEATAQKFIHAQLRREDEAPAELSSPTNAGSAGPSLPGSRDPSPSPTRWYRSGDLVSIDPRLGLIYRGRIDHEVKITGHRVHLGEIESTVSAALNGVWVAAMPWPLGKHGHAERISLFILAGSASSDDVMRACKESLLPYLVPNQIIAIATIPQTAQGKLDRKVLEKHLTERNQPSPTA